MSTRTGKGKSERGVALIIALISILVLSTLVAGIIFVSQTQVWTSYNYRMATQSRYAAEAGIQQTMNWLSNSYTAPSSFAAFNVNAYPVQATSNSQAVILSASSATSSNYPTASVQTAFNTALNGISVPGVSNATFSTTATLLRMNTSATGITWLGGSGGVIQTWLITSTGNVGAVGNILGNATVQLQAIYERTGTPIFTNAVAAASNGCKAIDFAGSDYTDSYNSNLGVYSVANSNASGGNIETNGNVTLGSSANIKGTISAPNVTTGACPNGITSSGSYSGTNKLTSNIQFSLPWGCSATPCYPKSTQVTTAQDVSTGCAGITGCTSKGTTTLYDNGKSTTVNVYSLSSSQQYGNLEIDNADVVHLSAGTYNINSLNFAKDGQIVVDSGPVVLNVAGSGYAAGQTVVNSGGLSGWNMCAPSGGTGVVGNPGAYGAATCGAAKTAYSGIPSNLQIVYAGAAAIATTGAPVSSAIYAPNALVETTGAAVGMYGSIISNTFLEASKAPVHYDTALGNVIIVGQFHPISFSWNKF